MTCGKHGEYKLFLEMVVFLSRFDVDWGKNKVCFSGQAQTRIPRIRLLSSFSLDFTRAKSLTHTSFGFIYKLRSSLFHGDTEERIQRRSVRFYSFALLFVPIPRSPCKTKRPVLLLSPFQLHHPSLRAMKPNGREKWPYSDGMFD